MQMFRQGWSWAGRMGSSLWRRTVRSERGEGVISAAIAVLIMAFLGVAMWIGSQSTLTKTQKNVDTQVTKIGTAGGGGGGNGGAVGGTGGSTGP